MNAEKSSVAGNESRTSRLLQVGLAFVFTYAAVSALANPSTYRAYLPRFPPLNSDSTVDALLRLFAVYELALAVGVLTPRFRRAASLLSAATLVAIVVVNGNAFEVLFRNVGIALGALALAEMSPGRQRHRAEVGPRTVEEPVKAQSVPAIALADLSS